MKKTSKVLIINNQIQISNHNIDDIYFINQGDDNRFYVTSYHGYNGFEGNGSKTLEGALKKAHKMIDNYFYDRSIDAPVSFK